MNHTIKNTSSTILALSIALFLQINSVYAAAPQWSNSSSNEDIPLGSTANANSSGTSSTSIAIGTDITSTAINTVSIAIGKNIVEENGISIGENIHAQGGISIGKNINPDNTLSNSDAITIGNNIKSYGIAMGYNISNEDDATTNIGYTINTKGYNNTIVGNKIENHGDQNVGLGNQLNFRHVAGSVGIGSVNNINSSYSIAIGSLSKTEGDFSTAIGMETNTKGKNSVALGTFAIASVDDSIALGSSSSASVDKGVIGYNVGTTDHRTNTYSGLKDEVLTSTKAALSIGTYDPDTNSYITRQINYISAGTSDSDAVNVAQLRNVNLKIAGNTTSTGSDVLLDSQTLTITGSNGLETTANNQTIDVKIDDATKAKIDSAVQRQELHNAVHSTAAQSAAIAGLKPIQFDPYKKTQIMAAVGSYRSEKAAALGLAHYANEDTLFHVGTTLGHHYTMINGGVTFKFGDSTYTKHIPNRYKQGPLSSIYLMQTDVATLQNKVQEQENTIKQLQEQVTYIDQLRDQNKAQQVEINELKSMLQQVLNNK